MKILSWLKRLFCRHTDWGYKIIPAGATCEGMQIVCRKCDKVLVDKGLDC